MHAYLGPVFLSPGIDYMVDYFVVNPHVATGKFQTLQGRSDLSASWEKLADELNNMWTDGKSKDVKSWKSTWRDNKTLVSQKVAKIRANLAATGNVTGPPVKLTERDQKILGLIGHDYVEGVDSPDAFPEEQHNAIELLAEGHEDVLELDAHSLTVRRASDIIGSTHYTNYDILDELLEDTDGTELLNDTPFKKQRVSLTTDAEAASPPLCAPLTSQQTSASYQNPKKNLPKPGRTTNTKKSSNRLGTQMQDAREDFRNLAERQISCMEMLAKTMKTMADNDKERNAILRTMVESQKTRDETFQQLATTFKDIIDMLKNK